MASSDIRSGESIMKRRKGRKSGISEPADDSQIARIEKYEDLMCKAEALIGSYSDDNAAALREMVNELEAYYASDEWKLDFAADEAGRLPSSLQRGVLSEDGLYDLLEKYHEL